MQIISICEFVLVERGGHAEGGWEGGGRECSVKAEGSGGEGSGRVEGGREGGERGVEVEGREVSRWRGERCRGGGERGVEVEGREVSRWRGGREGGEVSRWRGVVEGDAARRPAGRQRCKVAWMPKAGPPWFKSLSACLPALPDVGPKPSCWPPHTPPYLPPTSLPACPSHPSLPTPCLLTVQPCAPHRGGGTPGKCCGRSHQRGGGGSGCSSARRHGVHHPATVMQPAGHAGARAGGPPACSLPCTCVRRAGCATAVLCCIVVCFAC